MQIHTFKPVSTLLKEHIESFYVLQRTIEDPPVSYITFPKPGNLVSVYTDSITDVQYDCIAIQHRPGSSLQSRIVGRFDKAIRISYDGPANEINTIFRPLAINAFLTLPFSRYASGPFDHFAPSAGYLEKMESILALDSPEEKVMAMEAYWLSQYNGFSHPYLTEMVREIASAEGMGERIGYYSARFGVSRQTIHEQFIRYIGKSPSEFKKLVRFRHAVAKELKAEPDRLSRLSAMANYFDQSHMIRNFKSITGFTPKSFFSGISREGDAEANWIFL